MKIAMLVPDNRDEHRRYSDPDPYFGPAPTALLEGLAGNSAVEIHIVCCSQQHLRSPSQIAGNIFYHSLLVGKWGWMRGGYYGCVAAIKRKLREIKPDLVHGQGTERYCALAAVLCGFPNVVTIHGNMRLLAKIHHAPPFSFDWLAARLERFTLPRTEGVVCNSHHTQMQVASLAKRTWLVPNALQEIFFSSAQNTPVRDIPVLLNIGVIAPNKGQNTLLDIAAHLHERGFRFGLRFIGKLDEQTAYGIDFGKKLKAAKEKGYAEYLGQKSPAELIEIMDHADALVHLPMEESFGLVVAEGLARNLKFFGAKIGGVVDIAQGVEGAELVASGDWSALEEAMGKWLAAGHPRITSGARQMSERYHPTVVASKHVEIYREILHGP